MLLLIWDRDTQGVTSALGIRFPEMEVVVDMVLNKEFSRGIDSKRSQNMSVECRLLIIEGVVWVCNSMLFLEVISLI